MNSIWIDTAERPKFDGLKGDIKTDVLIIGGGICGILCAYMLKQAGVDCVLCEAGEICGGITKNTTAKITLQHGLIYDKIIRRYGVDCARLYFDAQRDAMQKYYDMCQKIGCDYEEKPSYVYSLDDRKKIEKEVAALDKIGCSASFLEYTELPISVAGAVRIDGQAQFHPLKFAFSVADGLPIYENTKILGLRPGGAVTEHGKITAKKIIVATHSPL